MRRMRFAAATALLMLGVEARAQYTAAPEGVELRLGGPAATAPAQTPALHAARPRPMTGATPTAKPQYQRPAEARLPAPLPSGPNVLRLPTNRVRYEQPAPDLTRRQEPSPFEPETPPPNAAPAKPEPYYDPTPLAPAETLPPAGAPTMTTALATGLQLADLENRALSANPAVIAAAARVQAARGRWLQAGLYPNPVATYAADEIGNNGRAGMHGLFISQEIVTKNKLGLARSAANQAIVQAEQQFAAAQFRVQNDIRGAFYEALIAQYQYDLARGPLANVAAEGVKTAEALLRAQEVSRIDVLQANIESDRTRIAAAQAGRKHAAAWRRLAAVLGDPNLPIAALAGDPRTGLPPKHWEEVRERTLSGSPQLSAALARVTKAEWAVRQACAERCPNVTVEVGSQYDFDTNDTVAGAQLSIPVPIHNRNQGNIRAAQAELMEAQADYRRHELAIEHELAQVFESYDTAREDVERHAADILPRSQEALGLVRAGYQQGELNYMTLLQSQRTWIEAQMTYFNALRQLRAADVALDGFLLKGSLEAR